MDGSRFNYWSLRNEKMSSAISKIELYLNGVQFSTYYINLIAKY